MDVSIQHECTVSGTLGFVLRLSQIYGVASLTFERVGYGWRIRVSRFFSLYGGIAVFVLSTLTVITIVQDFCLESKFSFHSRKGSDSIISTTTVSSVSAILFAAVLSARSRMTSMITCLVYLEKINSELNKYGPKTSFKQTKRIMATWSIVGGHVIVIIDCVIYFYEIYIRGGNLLMEGVYVTYYIESIMIKVLILQVSLILTAVYTSFNHLNNCLENILRRSCNTINPLYKEPDKLYNFNANSNISRKSINTIIDSLAVIGDTLDETQNTISATVNHLGFLFCCLGDVVKHINISHGFLMVPMVVHFLLHFIITPYNFITRLFGNEADFYKAIIQFSWVAYHSLDMVMIVEPGHQTQQEVQRMKYLISQLMQVTPRHNYTLIVELEKFYKHFTVTEIVYEPVKLFKLNRMLCTAIIGSITNYLAVVVEL